MDKTVIIKTYGDPALGNSIANVFESSEIKRLRAQIGVREVSRRPRYAQMIREARRKYSSKPMSKVWGYIGMIVLLAARELRA